jgi:hypothetical protein
MKSQFVENAESNNKLFAYLDARMRNAIGWTHYTTQERTRAERMVVGLGLVYRCKEVHVNPRKKFITVKLENAMVADRKMLKVLEADYEKEGITKVVSAQGVIYRIPKT